MTGADKLKLEQVAMVGDNIASDHTGGNLLGVKTVLVLSGVHSVEDTKFFCKENRPTCWLKDVGEIPKILGGQQKSTYLRPQAGAAAGVKPPAGAEPEQIVAEGVSEEDPCA
mmetsp:Transcript_16659/g.39967  ORF Transcript_16659/g.39967 Transcript_16659/m.39967 type:complete len:112 (-) Transcript_16659:1852-2187(-)